MRTCLCLIICLFFLTNVHAAQTCKPTSIPASTPDSQLLDNGNGTISDIKTGLMWKKCVEGVFGNGCDTGTPSTFTWQRALEQPAFVNNGSGFAGYYDWRLPNFKELTSIVERQCYDPAINLNRFPNTPSSYVWSGSPHAYYSVYAWVVHFGNGYSVNRSRSGNRHVRLVRGGQ